MGEITEVQLVYSAATFDCEGNIILAKIDRAGKYGRPNATPIYNLRISIGMQHLPVIKELCDLFGGKIYFKHQNVYRWIILSNKAEAFLRKIQPYVKVKKEQVELALAFQEYVHSRSRTSRKTDQECQMYESVKLQLQVLNRRDSKLFHEKSGEFGGGLRNEIIPSQASEGNGSEEGVETTRVSPNNNLSQELPTNIDPILDDIVRPS